MSTPNIIFILIDAGRYDRIGYSGYKKARTPALDALAEESLAFHQAYSTAPWTLPAVGSIFTGLYPHEHGLHFDSRALQGKAKSLIDIVASAGYVTLGATGNPWLTSTKDLTGAFDELVSIGRLFNTRPAKRWQLAVEKLYKKLINQHDAGGSIVTKKAIEWMARETGSQPFFMFLHYLEPHGPYQPKWQWASLFFESRAEFEAALRLSDIELAYLGGDLSLGATDLDLLSKLYDALIAEVDYYVGVLLSAARTKGLLDNTIVVVTADHGENLGDHQLIGHQYCLYDSLLHVPLLIRFPEIAAHESSDDLVLNTDLFATILSRLGFRENQFPWLTRWVDLHSAARAEPPEHAFALYQRPMIERFYNRFDPDRYARYNHEYASIRSAQHKLIRRDDGEVELFNVVSDPAESYNVASEQPEIAQMLLQRLMQEISPDTSPGKQYSDPLEENLDEITIERMRALGYMD